MNTMHILIDTRDAMCMHIVVNVPTSSFSYVHVCLFVGLRSHMQRNGIIQVRLKMHKMITTCSDGHLG